VGGGAANQLSVVNATRANRNEQIADGRVEGVSKFLERVEPDVDGDPALDPRDRGARDS
jgi:hypothetical protein